MVVRKSIESKKPRVENENNRKKALLVAQEISFAKVLAGNDKKLRDRGVKRLRKWLSARSRSGGDLKKEDFMRLWKGLFYCMWMADKPLFQEELSETISSLIHCFELSSLAIKFIEGFFKTMALEWKGIDQHRLDKFLMFVRRFLRQSLVFLKNSQWNSQTVDELALVFQRTLFPIHNQAQGQPSLGLVMHFTEIFLEEVAKVSQGNLNEGELLSLLKPFTHHLASVRDGRIRSHIRQHIFIRLLEQSPVGLEFQDKFHAWRKMGFPGGSIDVMEKVEDEDDEDEVIANAVSSSGALDPRAGHVDVELPVIGFNASNVAKFLEEYRFQKFTNAKTRKILADLISKFEKVAEGDYPLGLKEVPEIPDVNINDLTEEAAENLMGYEASLVNEGSDEDDTAEEAKENEHFNKAKKSGKKRKTELKQKLADKKKVRSLEKKNSDAVISQKVSKKEPVKKIRGKKTLNAYPSISEDSSSSSFSKENENSSLIIKNGVQVVKEERIYQVGNESNQLQVDMGSNASSNQGDTECGTDVLLQHLAPHLVKSKTPKRRASLPAKLQTSSAEDTDAANLECNAMNVNSAKKSKRRKSLWEEPLQDGEFEIFIPKEQIAARKKRLSDANTSLSVPNPSEFKLKNPFASPVSGIKCATPGSSSKKVNFVLQRNTAQATSDYFRTLRENPAIPFDATKEPSRSVLKHSPYSSPVNPFYKRKLKI